MELKPMIVGDGLFAQMEDVRKPTTRVLTYKVIEDTVREIMGKDIDEMRELVMYTGGYIIYGEGCKNLAQVRYHRICAIRNAKAFEKYFGIKKTIRFKYAPVKRNPQPWLRRRDKKHQR